MRYYVYISESKVDMLYSQIPEKLLETVAGKLTIDLKLIKTEFSEIPKEKKIHSKVQIIEKFLSTQNLIGNTKEPKEYFKDTKEMRWGPYDSGLVYFGSKSDVVIGLGGSEKHIIGGSGDSSPCSHSATPYLVAALNEQLVRNHGGVTNNMQSIESETLCAIEIATTQMTGLKQNMTFLAKTLLTYPSDNLEYSWSGRSGLPVILGTPIFVAIN